MSAEFGSSADRERARRLNCYCNLWESAPEALKKKGLPPGFCGTCDVCSRPGHTRQFPGAVPDTGSWCRYHYYRLMILHPRGTVGRLLWPILIIIAALCFLVKRYS